MEKELGVAPTRCLGLHIFIEQIMVNILAVFFSSISVTLICEGQIQTSEFSFVLDDIDFTLACGDSQNRTNLAPGREYTIFRRYEGQVLCTMTSFETICK